MRKQLNKFKFAFKAGHPMDFPLEYLHHGVVGSGDIEVLIERKELGGAVRFKVSTPISGYEEVWRRVLSRFVKDTNIGNASIEINDCNATPVVGSLRLRQALAEAKEVDDV